MARDGGLYLAALLGDDDGYRVGHLRDAERRAVARAVPARDVGLFSKRQIAARRDYLALVDDDRAVVQRRAGPEYRNQQLFGYVRVEQDGGAPHVLEARVALEHDERADALRLAVEQGLRQLLRALVYLLRAAADLPQMALAELFEHTAQLGLEQYRYDDDEGADHAAHDVRKAAKVEQVRRRADEADYQKAADKLHRPRADEQKQNSVYEESDYEYV